MKNIGYIFYLLVVPLLGILIPAYGQEEETGGMEDMFVHPFLTHMALPDKPGEMSLRITPFQQRTDSMVNRDLSLHIEAGLLPGLGIHIVEFTFLS